MHKLSPYQNQFVFLYTSKGVKLLGKPISEEKDNPAVYLFDVVEPAGSFPRGAVGFRNEEIGYVVELPQEVQQGLSLTLNHQQDLAAMRRLMASQNLSNRVEFGIAPKPGDQE